jgi:2-polyprenyl-3-methyl-5-hydroxy-6-metoxy-1,4-benzoquinol methylase
MRWFTTSAEYGSAAAPGWVVVRGSGGIELSHHKSIEHNIMGLIPESLGGYTILDAGTGEGLWGFLLRSQKRGEPTIIGVEPFTKHIEDLRRVHLYNVLYGVTAQQYLVDHPHQYFDLILLLEVVEHMSKPESFKMLEDLEKRLNPGGLLIVSTPDGFSEGAEGYAGNEVNRHVSGWNTGDFTSRGFTVFRVRKGVNWGFVVNAFASLWFIFKQGRLPVTHTVVAHKRRS